MGLLSMVHILMELNQQVRYQSSQLGISISSIFPPPHEKSLCINLKIPQKELIFQLNQNIFQTLLLELMDPAMKTQRQYIRDIPSN